MLLNEALNVVEALAFERVGEVVSLKEHLGEDRVLVVGHADEERVARLADSLHDQKPARRRRPAARPRAGFVYERIPKAEVEEPVLEEVPDIAYEDIGGLGGQIDQIRDAVEPAVPAPRPVPRAPAAPAEGRAALRPARLRQDAHRQGGRGLAGAQGGRAHRAAAGQVVLPEHQGSRAC
ncbi:hypothetical protein GCM10025868_46360 [Angustibacter aerolatus]|uniref:Proteasomal ATPase second OB domain-containing protein n=1 Tax=Angustibacter aerolatus TaxID=1162965 RepID=A0ABQ6JP82_9ACTN|nr:hypothetical protein GCM10025868_46360 [Angustibacter aerolatus]